MSITQQDLQRLFHYDPVTGIFSRVKPSSGRPLGTIDDDGYVRITIKGKKYRAQRLAFLYMTGSFPEEEVDHIDRVRTNNAWVNLRKATRQQNAANRTARGASGYKGVHEQRGRFVASMGVRGKKIYLGSFCSPEQAHKAYVAAANDNHGEFARAV